VHCHALADDTLAADVVADCLQKQWDVCDPIDVRLEDKGIPIPGLRGGERRNGLRLAAVEIDRNYAKPVCGSRLCRVAVSRGTF